MHFSAWLGSGFVSHLCEDAAVRREGPLSDVLLMTDGAGEEWLTVRYRTPLEYSRRAGHVSFQRA